MNSKTTFAVLLVSGFLWAAERMDIVSMQFTIVESGYALSDKSRYRLYTPSRAGVIRSLRKGTKTNGDYGNYRTKRHRNTIPPITLQEASVEMSGAYIVLLESYLVPDDVEKIGSNVLYDQQDDTPPHVKIGPFDDYRNVEDLAQSKSGTHYEGYHLFRSSSILPYRYSVEETTEKDFFRENSAYYLHGSSLLDLWAEFLKKEKFEFYGRPFFVRTPNGDVYPAVMKVFGVETLTYAMSGVWSDEAKASLYGFHKGDRIYFSAKSILPLDNDNTCRAAAELTVPKAQRYGKKIFTREEILADPENIYPQLAWAPVPVHSDMEGKQYDQTGTAYYQGIEVPNAPDNENNMNGMGLQQCPDMDWYWALFCECANKTMRAEENTYDPTEFVDYRDYAHMEMMQQEYDPTIYGEDNSVAPFKVNTETQPVDPFLFNKDCVLLNARVPEVYDPFASDATFSLYKKYYNWSFTDLGYKKKAVDVRSRMLTSLDELKHVYEYFTSPGKHRSDWSYYKSGNTWKNPWSHGGDVEVELHKPEYEDSAWYVANPFANYGPYEDFKTFAAFENNTARNRGPFRTISREYDTRVDTKKFAPKYRQYNDPWIGGDIPADQHWETKDWYIQWEYHLVHRDKWGRKVFVGTLTFTSSFWMKEDDGVMPSGYEFEDEKYNRFVYVGGTKLLGSQVVFYDKNSKDYRTDQTDVHDRDPEEFDKGEAMREIARKIIIAEAFDYAMKTLHYIGTHQNNQVGAAAAVLYEASKRVENRLAQSFAYKLAKNTYEGYVFWRRTMDILKGLRDTYIRIGDAWDGLLYTTEAIADYYSTLDLRNIRLTNITDLFPRKAFIELDYRLYSLQKSFGDFNAAVHAFALETDRLTGGNYGPLNPAIRATYAALQSSVLQSGPNTTQLLDNTSAEVQALKTKTAGTSSDQQYLSNITRSTYNIIGNQRIKVMNNGTRNVALALYMMESESKQWLAYTRYMKRIATDCPDRFDEAISTASSDSWAALAWSLHQPRVFEPATSDYLLELAEGQ